MYDRAHEQQRALFHQLHLGRPFGLHHHSIQAAHRTILPSRTVVRRILCPTRPTPSHVGAPCLSLISHPLMLRRVFSLLPPSVRDLLHVSTVVVSAIVVVTVSVLGPVRRPVRLLTHQPLLLRPLQCRLLLILPPPLVGQDMSVSSCGASPHRKLSSKSTLPATSTVVCWTPAM